MGLRYIVGEKTLEGLPLTEIYDACVMTGLPVTKRDVLNIQASMRIRQLDGLSSTQALLTRLKRPFGRTIDITCILTAMEALPGYWCLREAPWRFFDLIPRFCWWTLRIRRADLICRFSILSG
jgi:hypothetical protein